MRDVQLAPRTTLGVGGPARFFWEVASDDELVAAVRWARQRELPLCVLGAGSNVVVSDTGFPGLVIRLAMRGISRENGPKERIEVAAGEAWHPFVLTMVQENLQGIECLAGIPGLIGATPIQNVGAYGQEVSDVIESVVAFDIQRQQFRRFANRELAFGYRDSFFKAQAPGAFIVTRVRFRLTLGGTPLLKYAELERAANAFREEHRLTDLTLAQTSSLVLELRRQKSMSVDSPDENRRSCGSFFVNPKVKPQTLQRVQRALGDREVPHYPQPDGLVKLPAAWLIEQSGLTRGTRRGPVGLSTRHTLALVCHDGATATDVVAFASEVRRRVYDRFSVELTPEPAFWGFDTRPGELPGHQRPTTDLG